jgi:hypothetical protein
MNEVVLAQSARSPRAAGPAVRLALIILAVAVAVSGVLLIRGWRPTSSAKPKANPAPATVGMPTSPEIEAKYGIRLTAVAVIAGNGMVQLRYQILDGDKAGVLHDDTVSPAIITADGTTFADPGMPGHGHSNKVPQTGLADYTLLANSRGGIRPGAIVTVKVGDLELRNVRVV